MRLAAHLCRDRPHRHHRPWTKLVNLLTARTFSTGVATVLSPSRGYSMCAPYFVHLPHKLISAFLLAGAHHHPYCVTVIENIGFLVIPSHTVAFKALNDRVSQMSPSFDTSSNIFLFHIGNLNYHFLILY